MKRFTTFACLLVAFVFAFGATAGEMPKYVDGHNSVIHGGNLEMSKAASRDTVYLIGPWGSGAVENGEFEDASGAPNWNGWTSVDLTQKVDALWHVDTYNVPSGTYAAWCGSITYDACTELDAVGGYGSSYNELMVLRAAVGNTAASTTVDVTATVNHNTEPGYDFSNLGYYKADQSIAYLWTADGEGELVPVTGSVTYNAGEYVGDLGNEIAVVWHSTSDGGWDDSDCSYYGDGATQVDDVTVTVTNDGVVQTFSDDFEDGLPLALSGYGEWVVEFPVGVGDYAHIRSQLGDEDPCNSNYSPQACFIADDIMAVNGNPVAFCQDWCYGPGGYIVTTQGGFAGPESHLHNAIESPVIDWPAGDYLGVRFLFDAYRHEDLSSNAPGIFYTWGIRSAITGDDITEAGYQDRNFVYYGGPDYIRAGEADATDLVVADRAQVQVQMAVYELGYIWGWAGDDGYPAPYFDNVSLICYDYFGPGMSARELDLAQDAFPADGQIHVGVEMDQNDVRFDMANNIALATDLRNDPGDSVVFDIVAVRTGAALVETDVDATVTAPRMYFTVQMNPAFTAAMRLPVGAFTTDSDDPLSVLNGEILTSAGGLMTGYVQGAKARGNGIESPDRWQFDLPDADFLYPGDVLHWYVEAWDDVAGDYQNATMPADITGYGDFSGPLAYASGMTVRALPTLTDDTGAQPAMLFWNDFANRGGQDEWHGAFANLGFFPGADYDIYYTNAPSSGVSNGLGGRAALGQLYGYDTMIYTAGDLSVNTISNLDYENDAGDDVGVVSDWLSQGGKKMFATGDDLVSDMWVNGGTTTQAFVNAWMGLTFQSNDARPLLGGDTAPMVYSVAGNSVFNTTGSWIAYGGCRGINTFDAVTAAGGEMLAEFNDGASGLSAATKFVAVNTSQVITMPYDFRYIRTANSGAKVNQPAALPARAEVLREVLLSFGVPSQDFQATPAGLPGAKFAASNYPNPFNPSTKIEFTMPKAGHLSLKVYNVRGELVKTLIDEVRTESGHIMWDGTNEQGKAVSSGVYFYEARTDDSVVVNKMALVK